MKSNRQAANAPYGHDFSLALLDALIKFLCHVLCNFYNTYNLELQCLIHPWLWSLCNTRSITRLRLGFVLVLAFFSSVNTLKRFRVD